MRILLSIALLVSAFATAQADEDCFSVLVDTDGAPDDLRTLCMLLAVPGVELIAITTSDGALEPQDGGQKVRALLGSLGRLEIPVASGEVLLSTPPPWRTFCQAVPWGDSGVKVESSSAVGAIELMTIQLRSASEPLTVMCLGPLSNLAGVVESTPDAASNIGRILWYNDQLEPPSGTNYSLDPEAANVILAAHIPIDVISNAGDDAEAFDPTLLEQIRSISNPYAERIAASHSHPAVLERVRSLHFRLWDELLPVYLLHPELFRMEPPAGRPHHRISRGFEAAAVKKEIVEMLAGHEEEDCVLFRDFPDNPRLFNEDLRPYVVDIIRRHGREEWRLCVLTTELHQHLGIYSIVGAKMGLRAREVLGARMDELEIVSCAGNTPPISCLNDGLQVSTGATLGHGKFSTSQGAEPQPEAEFRHPRGVLRMRLKPEYWEHIRSDIAQEVQRHGENTTAYFDSIRRLGIQYWLEWSREDMFYIERQD